MTYTFQWMAVMVWLPTYAIEQRGLTLNYSAGLAATAVAINIFGNLFGTWLIHRGVAHWLLISIGTFVMGVSSLFIFPEIIPDHLRFIAILIFSFFGALQPSAIMANMPLQSPSRDQLAFTNGIVYQGSQAGNLLGPPIVACIIIMTGTWVYVGWFLAIGTIVNLILAQGIKELKERS